MKRVLITGATGFLGGAAAREMRRSGWEVIATGRNVEAGETLRRDGFTFEPCNLATDTDTLRHLVTGCEAVVHCAALSSPWGAPRDFQACNVLATQQVLGACRAEGARLVHISTPSVTFGFAHHRLYDEGAPRPEPAANHYIKTKREGEDLVRTAGEVSSVILRPKALIGPGDTTLFPRVLRTARRGYFPVFGGDDPCLDLTWIDDAAMAIRLALEAPDSCRGKTYHITSGQPLPVSALFPLLFEACGLTVRFFQVSTGTALAAAGLLEWFSRLATAGHWEPPVTRYGVGSLAYEQTLDISAARRDLGYSPKKDIREALADCGQQWRERYNPHA